MSQVPQKQQFGLFRGITGTKPNVRGNYERLGHYLEKILQVKAGRNFKNEEFVAVEKRIVHVFDNAAGQGHSVGEEITHMLMPKFPSFKGNIVSMVAGVLGCDPEAVTDELFESICSEAQPWAGWTIECYNKTIMTRPKVPGGESRPFTDVNYKRYVLAQELMEILSQDVKEKYYPGDTLEKLRASEQSQ